MWKNVATFFGSDNSFPYKEIQSTNPSGTYNSSSLLRQMWLTLYTNLVLCRLFAVDGTNGWMPPPVSIGFCTDSLVGKQKVHPMQTAQLSRFLSMSSVTAKKTKAAHVQTRVREQKCLVCEEGSATRGLCIRHYRMFLMQLKSRSQRDRVAYEEELIREGKVLASQQVWEIRRDDPFAIET